MRVERIVGARAWLAALMIPALAVSAFGQTPPTAAQPPVPQAIPPSGQTTPASPQQQTPPMPALPSTEPPPQPTGPTKRLTLDEAVQSALEQNVSLQVQRIDPRVQDYAVAQARTVWIPTVGSSVNYNNNSSPIDLSYLAAGAAASVNQGNATSVSGGISQLLPWGTSLSANWTGSRSVATVGQSFNPQTKGSLNFSFSQPVLRGLTIDNARQGLLISKVNREMSDITLRQVVVITVQRVKTAYWALVGARSNLDVAQQSLDLSRQTLKDNQTRVEVGTMAPIDIVQAQAEVASNEEQVIVAQAAVQQAEDTLRTLIYDPQSPDFWSQHLEPADTPTISPTQIDSEAAVKAALDKRTDLRLAQKSIDESNINIKYTKNQMLPALNVNAGYLTNGLGGLTCQHNPDTGQCLTDTAGNIIPFAVGYGSVLKDTFGATYPTWSVGFTVSYPIGASNAQLGLARARLQLHESELQVRNLQMTVAQQVRDVVRRVNTNLKRIDATRAARELSERKLEAEQKKFAVGLSTSFQVVQAQRDLATAKYNEVQAILDYTTSLADYDAVQETSVGTTSAGGQIVIAAPSSNGTGTVSTSSSSTGR